MHTVMQISIYLLLLKKASSYPTQPYEPEKDSKTYTDQEGHSDNLQTASENDSKEDYDHSIDYDAYPKYNFRYGVQDFHTGDIKFHQEAREGDVVKGHYSLVDPDGTLRTVEYSANDHTGFNAIVHRTFLKQHQTEQEIPEH